MVIEIFPVIDIRDIIYAYRYGWLRKLVKVTSTVVIRPDPLVANAFKQKITLREFLTNNYNIALSELWKIKFMMDHGIFFKDFEKIMGISKTPENIIKVYDTLGVDYGLSYDVPAKLFLLMTIDRVLDSLNGDKVSNIVDAVVEPIIDKIAQQVLSEIKYKDLNIERRNNLRDKIWNIIKKLLRNNEETKYYVEKLSYISAKETCRRFIVQLKEVQHSIRFRNLVPVVQGLFKEHIDMCIESYFNILKAYGFKDVYVAIGTGGRSLSKDDKERINYSIDKIQYFSKKYNISSKIHLLGWSSPTYAKGLSYTLVYSADSLTARRRAVEGKIYIFNEKGEIKLVNVKFIDPSTYHCNCPVCRDKTLRNYVLDPSGARKNDARIVHNLYMIRVYLQLLANATSFKGHESTQLYKESF